MLKMLHIGQCHTQHPFSSLQQALIPAVDEYYFVSSSDKEINEKSVVISREKNPNIVFIHIQAPDVITDNTVKILKANGAWVVNWTGDVRRPTPRWFYDIGQHIDLTLFSNEEDAIILRERGVNAGYLQIGIDEKIFTPVGETTYDYDVVFMANNYENDFPLSVYRKELAYYLRQRLKNRFGLYGQGWQKIHDGNVYGNQLEEAAIYRGSKMGINVSHFDLERYSSDRLYRLMGSGTLCLCKEFKGWYRDFEDGENIIIWKDKDDLMEKIKYFTDNESERKRIAANGAKLVHDKFKFKDTVNNLLDLYYASI